MSANDGVFEFGVGGRDVERGRLGWVDEQRRDVERRRLGRRDVVVARYDAAGHHVFSHRYGGAGVSVGWVSVRAALTGDIYVLTSSTGAVDFGGGAVNAVQANAVVARFTGAGDHRWSRAISSGGSADFDACGALYTARHIAPPTEFATPHFEITRYQP